MTFSWSVKISVKYIQCPLPPLGQNVNGFDIYIYICIDITYVYVLICVLIQRNAKSEKRLVIKYPSIPSQKPTTIRKTSRLCIHIDKSVDCEFIYQLIS